MGCCRRPQLAAPEVWGSTGNADASRLAPLPASKCSEGRGRGRGEAGAGRGGAVGARPGGYVTGGASIKLRGRCSAARAGVSPATQRPGVPPREDRAKVPPRPPARPPPAPPPSPARLAGPAASPPARPTARAPRAPPQPRPPERHEPDRARRAVQLRLRR